MCCRVEVSFITNLKFILWKPPNVIINEQTYSAVLHISSVSLFRGRGMPVLNKNQIINIKQIKC